MVKRIAETRLPTQFGRFRLYAYKEDRNGRVHLALVKGETDGAPDLLVRIHSECLTGDVFHSWRCDCGDQLDAALETIQDSGMGIFVYLRQEGRGIGLVEKLRAYELQDKGLDTVEANAKLGFRADQRDYEAAISILHDLDVTSVRLLTNNPMKVSGFDGSPIKVVERVPLETRPNHENVSYLKTKRDRLGHILDLRD